MLFLTQKNLLRRKCKKISNKKNRYELSLKSRVFFSMHYAQIFVSHMDSFPIFILANTVENCFDIAPHARILSFTHNMFAKNRKGFSQYRWILIQKIIKKCNEIQNNPAYWPSYYTRRQKQNMEVFFFIFYISRKSSDYKLWCLINF